MQVWNPQKRLNGLVATLALAALILAGAFAGAACEGGHTHTVTFN